MHSLSRFALRGFSVALLAVLHLTCLYSQATTSLRGTIADAQGAAIPEVVVTLTNLDTSAPRKVVSDASGNYQFLQVPPGRYQVQAEKPGFSAVTNNITLQVNTPATINLALSIGQVTETVNVQADVATINTVDASVGNAFTETQVRQLPLLTRNVVELLSIQPGVTQTGEVLGARRDQNNVTLDGVDVNDNQNSGIQISGGNGSNANSTVGDQRTAGFNAALPVPLDSVQEFRVTVAGQGANQGRSSGGQVSLVTKSGSNDFHGSLYEFHRNTATAANSWFNNRAGIGREALIRNQFGASLGGRIIRNRAFFFVNWEQRIDASGRSVLRQVPSAALRQGIVTFRTADGSLQTLSPAELRQIDPRGIGVNPFMLSFLQQYPLGNDLAAGTDRGLNFVGYRFNAPFTLDDKAYVAKLDFNLDTAGKHTLSLRGTLADQTQDLTVAQFAGQSPAQVQLNNSKGLSAVYTTVISPTLVNIFTLGFTRIGIEQSGNTSPQLSFDGISDPVNYIRGSARRLPTLNLVNDMTWTKNTHTVTAGVNFRFIRNARDSYNNSYPSYSFGRNTLRGLGSDISAVALTYLRDRSSNSALAFADAANFQRAVGDVYGLINNQTVFFQYDNTGTAANQGDPTARRFATNEYEFYLGDSWRARPGLTLNYGVRYSNYAVPWETNGIQVTPTVGLDTFWAQRLAAAENGVSNATLPAARLQYQLAGPINGAPSWYKRDNNNWAPRFSFAYSPEKNEGFLSKIFGKGSVLRGGAAMVYDRFGSDLVTVFDRTGSPGLSERINFAQTTDFTTAIRYNGSLPALPTAPQVRFPYTPPDVGSGFSSQLGISPDLVAPYSIVMNMSYARELPGKLSVEVGYAGRLNRKNLLQSDYFTPLTTFKDPASKQTWQQMSTVMRQLRDNGVTPAQVRANPSLVPQVPFVENMFPALQNFNFAGSASANYFDLLYQGNGGSHLDALDNLDRVPQARLGGQCLSRLGCNTFFPLQGAGAQTWVNAGRGHFQGGTLTVRRALSSGFAFDFNYTLSHSIDNGSGAESGSGQTGAILQSPFYINSFRGDSDFDIRHNITANGLVELPFGRNKRFLGGSSAWVDQIVGGWQISTLMRYRSGLPSTISAGGVYDTNLLSASLAIPVSGVVPAFGPTFNQNGAPSLFSNTNAIGGFAAQYPGTTGQRAIVRLDDLVNFDLSLAKSFAMPFEGHRLQFRAEAFNAFNNVNFLNPSLRLDRATNFGEFQETTPPRTMQFVLRYTF